MRPLWRGPRATVVGWLLLGTVFLVSWKWSSLSWHARGVIVAAYGVILLSVLLFPALRTRSQLKGGAQAQGTVVGAKQQMGYLGDNPTTYYHPVVRFTTPDGRTVEFTAGIGSGAQPKTGVRVPVRYRPDDPEDAELDRPITWVLPAAFGSVGGLGLLVAGVVMYVQE